MYIVGDVEEKVERIIEEEPLSPSQVQELLPHYSGKYIIPHVQQYCKMHALILYNTTSRPGAEDEATNLDDALRAAGFTERTGLQWTEASELHNMIESCLDAVVNTCSLLMVCLMSHGSIGSLEAGGGNRTQVNSILHQLKQKLPSKIPLVSEF